MPAASPVQSQQLELPFALLDVQGRTILTVKEIADKLHCTSQHVCELIRAQELAAINIGLGESRMSARIPVESFTDFVIRSMTCPFAQSPLRHLPVQSLVRLYNELANHLRSKGVRV